MGWQTTNGYHLTTSGRGEGGADDNTPAEFHVGEALYHLNDACEQQQGGNSDDDGRCPFDPFARSIRTRQQDVGLSDAAERENLRTANRHAVVGGSEQNNLQHNDKSQCTNTQHNDKSQCTQDTQPQDIRLTTFEGPSRRALIVYFAVDLVKESMWSFVLVLVSCLLALYFDKRHHAGLSVSFVPIAPMQVVLGFLVGFYLNKAFERNKKAFEGIQALSVHTRSLCHHYLWFLFNTYHRKYVKHVRSDFLSTLPAATDELVALCKFFFLYCCADLNLASFMKESGEDETSLKAMTERLDQWWEYISMHVTLCPLAKQLARTHRQTLQSGLYFARMVEIWLDDRWSALAPSEENFLADPLSRTFCKDASKDFHVANLACKTEMTKIAKHFTSLYQIANGRKSPVHFWLLGFLLITICCLMPWIIARDYGYLLFIPSLLLAYIFFGARQIGADFWEPFGMDANGLVDINLEDRSRVACRQLDEMLSFFEELLAVHQKNDSLLSTSNSLCQPATIDSTVVDLPFG